MGINRRSIKIRVVITSLWLVLFTGLLSAQSVTVSETEGDSATESGSAQTNEEELASVQEQLFELLLLSPKLTSALSYDPSLLGYREYVNANNPELGRFLDIHPEVTRNPEFYLFGRLRGNSRRNIPPVFRQTGLPAYAGSNPALLSGDIIAFLVFIVVLGAVLWLLRLIVQNRRWGRVFKAQTEVHTKLLDKIGGSPELLNYLETEAGKKFMNLAPVSGAIESPQHPGTLNPISRMLAPLQVGIVAAMIGIGILFIRTALEDSGALLLFGTLGIMLGIGLILSAGISWVLARRLGWISQNERENEDSNKASA
ncbi:MAG: hypothetical protein P8Y80_06360 [Acidobacteriota bacterium]